MKQMYNALNASSQYDENKNMNSFPVQAQMAVQERALHHLICLSHHVHLLIKG